LADNGTTILLTTQYLEEADQLADDITVMDEGKVIAEGTPEELKTSFGVDWLEITLPAGASPEPVLRIVRGSAAGEPQFDSGENTIRVPVANRTRALIHVASKLAEISVEPLDIAVRRPSLDEVFLTLTGKTKTNNAVEEHV
jgi:ABC-2 type transport system ATP-binding protein